MKFFIGIVEIERKINSYSIVTCILQTENNSFVFRKNSNKSLEQDLLNTISFSTKLYQLNSQKRSPYSWNILQQFVL